MIMIIIIITTIIIIIIIITMTNIYKAPNSALGAHTGRSIYRYKHEFITNCTCGI